MASSFIDVVVAYDVGVAYDVAEACDVVVEASTNLTTWVLNSSQPSEREGRGLLFESDVFWHPPASCSSSFSGETPNLLFGMDEEVDSKCWVGGDWVNQSYANCLVNQTRRLLLVLPVPA